MDNWKIGIIKAGIPLPVTDPPQKWSEQWSYQIYAKAQAIGKVDWGETLHVALNSLDIYYILMHGFLKIIEVSEHNDVRGIWKKMSKASFTGGYGITTGTISAIDNALWNLKARESSLSLSPLFGGTSGNAKRYASLSRYDIWEEAMQVVCNPMDRGYTMVKLHQSSIDIIDAIKLIKKELGNEIRIAADMNCAFNFNQARGLVENLAKYESFWIEVSLLPYDDYDNLARLNRTTPIVGGENECSIKQFSTSLKKESLSYYQQDVSKIGCITSLLELISIFKTRNAGIAFHSIPHNGFVSIIESACVAIGTNIGEWIETPPTEISEEYFQHSIKIENDIILPEENRISLSPREHILELGSSATLTFYVENQRCAFQIYEIS